MPSNVQSHQKIDGASAEHGQGTFEHFGEGQQHEGALGDAGVGNGEGFSRDLALTTEEQVDVDGAGAPASSRSPAEEVFDLLGDSEQASASRSVSTATAAFR